MIFIANTLVLNGGTTFLHRISRLFHECGHKVLIIVIQGPCSAETIREWSGFSTLVMLDDLLSGWVPVSLHSNAAIFFPFDKVKTQKLIEEYGSHVHVMGVFGLFSALKMANLDNSVRISAGIYQQNEYFLRGKSHGISSQMVSLFKKLPVENVINFNEHGVKEYTKIMGVNYLMQNIVPIGVLPVRSTVSCQPEPYKIVSVGNLVRFKKYNEHVIRLLGVLGKKFPRVRYDIYGDGPEREKLVDLTATLGLSECVTFHGSIPYSEFQQAVSTGSVFVGSGTAILEAAMLGVPSIVGIESTEEPITYGFIFECEGFTYNEFIPSKKTVPIEAKLTEIFEGTPGSVSVISERCRQKAYEFTIDRTYDGFSNIERGLSPTCEPLTLVEIVLFSFWMFITIMQDFLNIDRSFRFRRDLT